VSALPRILLAAAVFAALTAAGGALASPEEDRESIRQMLDSFLSNVDSAAAHADFWADDLVYTSSDGTRRNKQAILESFENPDGPGFAGTRYSAMDVDVRVYGDTAVLAFRLVADAGDGEKSEFFNTGTLLKRDGRWQVVAWQATRIPG
jgi:ketosteroid isomerase-like protein